MKLKKEQEGLYSCEVNSRKTYLNEEEIFEVCPDIVAQLIEGKYAC